MMGTVVEFKSGGYIFTTSELEMTECGCCGIPFAVPTELLAWSRREPHRNFYCPSGHVLHYPGKSETEKLKEARDELARERADHDQTQARLIAQKGATTRIKNQRDTALRKAHAGICPVPGCGRHLKDLTRHMKSKHPDFEPTP